ncbi:polymer-forming cytoskeletal protein, partial [Rodentibacter pneumotropicus]
MTKKYELLKDDTKEYFGITLYRIRALISFGAIVAGELGGYIEAEKNLAQSGDAWVFGDALVSGDAWVSGNANVYGNAW